jgi:hypothetical protein
MRLRLRSSTRFANSPQGPVAQFVFSVLDLDRSESFPENFVCLLPKELKGTSVSGKSKFLEIFGDDSIQLAVELLKDALRKEGDVDIKREIERRLKLFEPKKPITAKCRVCGRDFEYKKCGRFAPRICQDCKINSGKENRA